jgi:hypothetical protein
LTIPTNPAFQSLTEEVAVLYTEERPEACISQEARNSQLHCISSHPSRFLIRKVAAPLFATKPQIFSSIVATKSINAPAKTVVLLDVIYELFKFIFSIIIW